MDKDLEIEKLKGERDMARVLLTAVCEKNRELGRLSSEIKTLKEVDEIRSNILGRIAIALFGEQNNVTDEQCLMGVEALKFRVTSYDKAHELFDYDLVQLLHRCQNGDASCRFTASVIEVEYEKLRVKADECEEVLRELALNLSVGGYNSEEFDPQLFKRKIDDGIKMLVEPLMDRIKEKGLDEKLKEA